MVIAEDDPISRELLRRRLLRMGHEVLEAEDGEAALRYLKEQPVQCIVTDWMMPQMDGLELTRSIRAAKFPHYVYIILLTAKTDIEDVVLGLESGADDYLVKPFNVRELKARLGIATRIVELEQSLRETRDRLETLATRDSLTGLYNRGTITESAEAERQRALREKRPIGFLMLDLDHFKTINDRFGHMTGDAALRVVAEVLNKSTRIYDRIGRWGGEEFLVVLPGATAEVTTSVAERIRCALADTPLPLDDGGSETLSASVGAVVLEPGWNHTLDEVLRRVDEALYSAKAAGRNRVCLMDVGTRAASS